MPKKKKIKILPMIVVWLITLVFLWWTLGTMILYFNDDNSNYNQTEQNSYQAENIDYNIEQFNLSWNTTLTNSWTVNSWTTIELTWNNTLTESWTTQ